MPDLLFVSNIDDPEPWRRVLGEIAPDVRVHVWPDDTGVSDRIDCALVWNPPPGLLATLPNLRLIQSLGAGVDTLLADRSLPQDVPIARVVDPLLTQCMVEYVVLHVLHHHRLMTMFARQQAQALWREEIAPPAQARTVGTLGLGEMGAAAGRAVAALGFPVLGWSRGDKTVDGIVCHAGPAGFDEVVAGADILVCLLPLTAETEDILDAALFARMRRGAVLINCGRGRHLVDADLLGALDSGQISAASLDVFRQEPLPHEHPFWARPEIVVTPHVASLSNPDSAAALLVDNIRRVWAGESPRYQVDPARGY